MCVSVCPDVRYARPHLWTDFSETWQGGTWAFWAPAKLIGLDVTSGSVTCHTAENRTIPSAKTIKEIILLPTSKRLVGFHEI